MAVPRLEECSKLTDGVEAALDKADKFAEENKCAVKFQFAWEYIMERNS